MFTLAPPPDRTEPSAPSEPPPSRCRRSPRLLMTRAEHEAAADCTGTRVEWPGFSGETRGGEPLGQVWPVHGFNDDGSFATATRVHNKIVTNLILLPGALIDQDVWQLESQACEVGLPTGRRRFSDTVLTRVPSVYAPHPGGKELMLLNPSVVFEVLSDSAAEVDLEDKPADYLSVPSVTDHVVIDQEAALVIHHRRDAGAVPARWRVERHEGLGGAIELADPAAVLPLADLYARTPLARTPLAG